MFTKLITFFVFTLALTTSFLFKSEAAVILQYHHVSDNTPKSTSISPKQFKRHLQYLAEHEFNVIPLPKLVNALQNQQALPDKTVVITFDDAYSNIMSQAKPILDEYNFPYTIFVNPKLINSSTSPYLSWQQLKHLAELPNQQVTIANHGLIHDSFARPAQNTNHEAWFNKQTQDLLTAEALIEKHTGQAWKYFAYPYGEYTHELQTWLKQNNFIAFTQQSGAVGLHTDLTIIPRFPASQPYDQLETLTDKLYSLPLNITLTKVSSSHKQTTTIEKIETIAHYKAIESATFTVNVNDFKPNTLSCYVTQLGKQKIEWLAPNKFTINFSGPLPVGRVRANCTAPSIENPSRYYWFSQPWFILNADGTWFPL